jgi:hypothetical protein
LVAGALAVLLLAAPGLADREIQSWILSWWPCQNDTAALLPGLWLLGATAQYSRTFDRRWGAFALFSFALAVLFKEMGYIAGLGACLLLLRQRKAWGLLAVLAAEGVLLFALRWFALQHAGGVMSSPPTSRQGTTLRLFPALVEELLVQSALQFLALGVGIAAVMLAARFLRGRTLVWEQSLALGGITYLLIATLLIGPPQDPLFQYTFLLLLRWVWWGLVLAGILLAVRNWAIPELIGVFLLSVLAVSGYPPSYGWYQYWASVFAALLAATGLVTLGVLTWTRILALPTKSENAAGSTLPYRQ